MDELCRRNLVNVLVTDGEEVLTRTPRVLGHSGRIVHTAHSNWCDNIPESTPGTLHFLMLLGKAKERIYLLLRNIHDIPLLECKFSLLFEVRMTSPANAALISGTVFNATPCGLLLFFLWNASLAHLDVTPILCLLAKGGLRVKAG